jgi:predicted ATP-grasp superfamily ATP-dependent carboligase
MSKANGSVDRPTMLLTSGHYLGTLAAARSLGREGIRVTLAESDWSAATRWSRYVQRWERCPHTSKPLELIDWLVSHGSEHHGQVLYATSDSLAVLQAAHRDELAQHYKMFQPPLETILTLLDKARLHDACEQVGLRSPRTWTPADAAEVARLAPELPYPILIKPRTQVLLLSGVKGGLVERPQDLVPAFERFVEKNRYAPDLERMAPGAGRPMLQEFISGASEGIYSLSGYVDERRWVARASVKVLQWPRKLGVGICFEDAPVEAELAEKLQQLCRRVGYRGVFEVEFVRAGDHRLLMDFNPRFYGQMGFDVARGLNLPLLAYLAAVGDEAGLDAALAAARQPPAGMGWCHSVMLGLSLRGQQLLGVIGAAEAQRWRAWRDGRRGSGLLAEAFYDREDRWPWLVDALQHLRSAFRYPRGFVRHLRQVSRAEPHRSLELTGGRRSRIGAGSRRRGGDSLLGEGNP